MADPSPDLAAPSVVELLPPLRRYVGARLSSPHDVDDVVQETVERLLAVREPAVERVALSWPMPE